MSEKITLFQALFRLNEFDDLEGEDLDLQAQLDAIENIKERVDAYKYIFDKLEAEADFWSKQMKAAKAKKDAREKALERLEERMLQTMITNNMTMLSGSTHQVKISQSERVELLVSEPSLEDKMNFPHFCKAKWSFSAEAVKAAIKAGDESALKFGKLTKHNNLSWKLSNGI